MGAGVCGDGQGHPAPVSPGLTSWLGRTRSELATDAVAGAGCHKALTLSEPACTTPLHHTGKSQSTAGPAVDEHCPWESSPRTQQPLQLWDEPRQSLRWHRAADLQGSPSRGGGCSPRQGWACGGFLEGSQERRDVPGSWEKSSARFCAGREQ